MTDETDRQTDEVILGIVSDTHIPDRVHELHPDLMAGLRQAGVERIIHAGDISSQWTLDQLALIAPVEAVRGNRDILTPAHLPFERRFEINGVRIYLAHGHGGLVHYLIDKGIHILEGYKFPRYQRFLGSQAGNVDVIIFGHTHRPENRKVDGILYFNPGSAGPNYDHSRPSYGVLRISREGAARGEIHYLENFPIKTYHWIKN